MNSGPDPDSSRTPEPELPGEFVTDDLRSDCARFLSELRDLIQHRRELLYERAGWRPDDRAS